MVLQSQDILFNPSLEYGVSGSFYDLIDGLARDIYRQAKMINRLSSRLADDYTVSKI